MWLVLGWTFVGLGLVGLLVPVLPTVPFLIVAAYCFEKGSPRLHAWLLNHKRLGPPLRDWQESRVIRLRAKVLATFCILSSLVYLVVFRDVHVLIKVLAAIIMLSANLFILWQKDSP